MVSQIKENLLCIIHKAGNENINYWKLVTSFYNGYPGLLLEKPLKKKIIPH